MKETHFLTNKYGAKLYSWIILSSSYSSNYIKNLLTRSKTEYAIDVLQRLSKLTALLSLDNCQ